MTTSLRPTRPVLAASNAAAPLEARALADACHAAALRFLRDAPAWGREEVCAWLEDSYAELARLAPIDETTLRPLTLLAGSSEATVRAAVARAHAELRAVVSRLGDRRYEESLALAAFSFGFVARKRDRHGRAVFVPTNRPRRLADRVMSLVAADLLARSWAEDDEPASSRHRVVVSDYLAEAA